MRTELVQQVTVSRYAMFAEMAWLEHRPELGALCRHGREAGGRLSPAVVQRALPGLADKGAENVVRRCAELDLCDRAGSLRDLGEQAADTDRAPVPEQGVYDMWAVFHPLLGARMLHAERLAPTRDGRFDFDSVWPLPVQPEPGRTFTSVVDSQQRFLLRALPANHGETGGLARRTNAVCTIRWTIDWSREANEFRLDGVIDTGSGRRPVQHAPEPVEIDLWRTMDDWRLGPLADHGEWLGGTDRRLAVRFDGLTEAEQESFTRDVELGDAEIAGFGRWRGVRLTSVPIGPLTTVNATAWAMARLDRRLRDDTRHTRSKVRGLFAEETEETPLAPHAPVLPAHDDLLNRYRDEPEVFWHLAAPVDLAPFPVAAQELGSMTIGEAAPGAATGTGTPDEDGAIVRLPYRCGWSMHMLLERLTGGAPVRRLLLADRYVRGRANLTALRLLVETIAWQGAPSVEVWTGDDVDEAALAEIHRITDVRPRRYGKVFGRAGQPHDRYLVVVPVQGAAFGWQMSNSPLDARLDRGVEATPVTALRWRDLTATRIPVRQLWEPMAAWASEEDR